MVVPFSSPDVAVKSTVYVDDAPPVREVGDAVTFVTPLEAYAGNAVITPNPLNVNKNVAVNVKALFDRQRISGWTLWPKILPSLTVVRSGKTFLSPNIFP